jgi:hypothetical protein
MRCIDSGTQWRPKHMEAKKRRHWQCISINAWRWLTLAHRCVDRLIPFHIAVLASSVVGLSESDTWAAVGDQAYYY